MNVNREELGNRGEKFQDQEKINHAVFQKKGGSPLLPSTGGEGGGNKHGKKRPGGRKSGYRRREGKEKTKVKASPAESRKEREASKIGPYTEER